MHTLPFGRLHQAGDDAVGFEPLFRSRSEAHFAEDYQLSQRLLGMIICRGYAWMPKESKKELLLRPCQISPQCLGGFEYKRPFADVEKSLDQTFLDIRR